MILSRNQFFLALFLIVAAPFLATKLFWLLNSKKTKGVMAFISHADWGSATGMSTYAVIDFSAENQMFSIRSEISTDLKRGEAVPILCQKGNPNDAVVNDFMNIWVGTLSYAIFPELVIIVLFIMP